VGRQLFLMTAIPNRTIETPAKTGDWTFVSSGSSTRYGAVKTICNRKRDPVGQGLLKIPEPFSIRNFEQPPTVRASVLIGFATDFPGLLKRPGALFKR
jgi:hypothetical protein